MTAGSVEKKRIVIAATLKPVDDIRMTQKIGASLSESGWDVHVIGFPAFMPPGSVKAHPLPFFRRISLTRALIPWLVLGKFLKLKARLIIITTHELLLPAIFAKWLTGCKVFYDVQENYYNNIRFTKNFPFGIRYVLASYVRLVERMARPFVDHFLLAERSYADELPFVHGKSTTLENKLKRPAIPLERRPIENQLLFSGTLSENTGVFKAIEIAIAMHAIDPSFTLVIVGYCAKRSELDSIKRAIAPHQFVRLIGGDALVAHDVIVQQILLSDAGIISYPPNKSTFGSIPTKLYEYLGFRLPIILVRHPVWVGICNRYQAAYVFDTQSFDANGAISALRSREFYKTAPDHVFWDSEVFKLHKVLEAAIN